MTFEERMEELCVCGHTMGAHNGFGECTEHHRGGWPPWYESEYCNEFESDWEANDALRQSRPSVAEGIGGDVE